MIVIKKHVLTIIIITIKYIQCWNKMFIVGHVIILYAA